MRPSQSGRAHVSAQVLHGGCERVAGRAPQGDCEHAAGCLPQGDRECVADHASQSRGRAVEGLLALADLYSLIGVLLRLPTEETAQGLATGTLFDDVAAIGAELRSEAVERLGSQAKERLASESPASLSDLRGAYTAMFTHPTSPCVPNCEQRYLWERREYAGRTRNPPPSFVNPAALDAERCYKAAGLKRNVQLNVPPDCMYVETDFMGWLSLQQARALLEGDGGLAERCRKARSEFCELHLDKWARAFFLDCKRLACEPAFEFLGDLGGLAMEIERGGALAASNL